MPYFYFDQWYFLLVVPAMILGLIAQVRVKSAYSRWSGVRVSTGLTGTDAARIVLQRGGVRDVQVTSVGGQLTDHYDPAKKSLALSEGVYGAASVAAVGIAAHEAGHALQHAEGYFPLKIRTAIIPLTRFGSAAAPFVLLAGVLFSFEPLVLAGILCFSLAALFQLVTLPVEFNASRRALTALEESGVIRTEEERTGVKRVLSAAAMTYVAALISSLATILRLLLLFTNRRR
ncbi:MAG: zinc metallopeptidase [Eubacteriales bacterium]|nr:zinc metallopeptidase [Eubacteriales bacterium]